MFTAYLVQESSILFATIEPSYFLGARVTHTDYFTPHSISSPLFLRMHEPILLIFLFLLLDCNPQ